MTKKNFLKNILIFEGILLFAMFGIVYYMFSNIKTRNENISKLNHELSDNIENREYTLSVQKYFEVNKNDIAKVDNFILSSDGDVKFIESLEGLAKSNGLDVSIESLDLKDDPSFKEDGITKFVIKAKISGKWNGVYNFLSQLESIPYKIKVSNLVLSQFSKQSSGVFSSNSQSVWQSRFEMEVLKYK